MKALINELTETAGIEPELIPIDVRVGVEVKAFLYVKDGKIKRYTPPDAREVAAQIKDGTAKVTSVVGASRREVLRAAKKSGLV